LFHNSSFHNIRIITVVIKPSIFFIALSLIGRKWHNDSEVGHQKLKKILPVKLFIINILGINYGGRKQPEQHSFFLEGNCYLSKL